MRTLTLKVEGEAKSVYDFYDLLHVNHELGERISELESHIKTLEDMVDLLRKMNKRGTIVDIPGTGNTSILHKEK